MVAVVHKQHKVVPLCMTTVLPSDISSPCEHREKSFKGCTEEVYNTASSDVTEPQSYHIDSGFVYKNKT